MARAGEGNEQLLCSFCGKSQRQVKKLIAGPGVYICDECIDLCNEIIDEELTTPSTLDLDNLPRPKEIYAALNDYVVSQEEAKRILSMPDLQIAATCVRVPVAVGHSVSVEAAFECPVTPAEAREILASAPGVQVRDDPANLVYPSPLEAAGIDDVLVGRIRQHPDRPDTLLLFACGDNLRKGAALNAVQIAEAVLASA